MGLHAAGGAYGGLRGQKWLWWNGQQTRVPAYSCRAKKRAPNRKRKHLRYAESDVSTAVISFTNFWSHGHPRLGDHAGSAKSMIHYARFDFCVPAVLVRTAYLSVCVVLVVKCTSFVLMTAIYLLTHFLSCCQH